MIDAQTVKDLMSRLSLEEKKECLRELAGMKISHDNAEEVYRIVRVFESGLDVNLALQVRAVCKKLESEYPNRFSFEFLNNMPNVERLVKPPVDSAANEKISSRTKTCPYCAETIQEAAKKCRFCNESLESVVCQKCGGRSCQTLFCVYCDSFLANPQWVRPSFAHRILAFWIDFPVFLALLYIGSDLTQPVGLILLTIFVILQALMFKSGTSIGKRAAGLSIVSASTGGRPGFFRVLFRETIGRIISLIFVGVGFFWSLIDENGQTWHDKLSGSVVVKDE